MNILQILPELNIGGVERGTIELARFLVDNDHKAVVVSGGGRLVRELDIIGARHYTLPVGKKSIFTMTRMVWKLCDIIKRENIDIVHARSRVPAWIAFAACRMTGCYFVTTAHGYYKNRFTSRVMGWGKFVIVASHSIAKRMIEGFNVPYPRIRHIPRGVDPEKFKFTDAKRRRELKENAKSLSESDFTHAPVPLRGIVRGSAPRRNPGDSDVASVNSSSFTIGVISRITPIKGHEYFIKALSVVSRVVPKLKVLIIGEPSPGKEDCKKDLELLIKRLALTRIIEFTGWQDDVPKVLSQLDLLVLPTITPEAFGRVIIEAQACGVPVVATKVGGVVELVEDGVNGLLVPPEDVRSLQDAIVKIAKDKDLAQRLSENGRENAKKYSFNKMATETIGLYEEVIERKNILVIKTSALGDVILSIPSLRAIRSAFPKALIKVLVGQEARQVLKGCPYIDEIIVCDFKARHRSIKGLMRLGTALRRNNFDMVIDLQNSRRSHLLSFLTFAPLRCGYDNGKFSLLLNKKVKDTGEYIDPVSHQFKTLALAGIKSNDKRLEIWPQEEEEEWAEKFLHDCWIDIKKQCLVGISPKASKRWISKSWPIEKVAALCDELAGKHNARVIITGTKDDLQAAKEISSMAKSKPIIAIGKTDLLQLAAIIKRCNVFITTDSATMHVASAVKTPFVALFGPTEPERHVSASGRYTILTSNAKCRPCYKATCARDYACMKDISVEEVTRSIKEYLKR
ncbi:MAG: lipopolysaccharide heptosyltransferase II [Candidatus Omnitrophota bacterium]